MRLKGTLMSASLFSTMIFLLVKIFTKNGSVTRSVRKPHTLSPPRSPPIPVERQSVTLKNGNYTYHLNLTSFEEEFPHLQSYNCSILLEPHPEEHGGTSQKVLILAVKSQPRNGARRFTLRETWAKKRDINGYRVHPIFLLGDSQTKGQREIVKLESQEYGDILQWDMAEGHHNLSLKERCFLEWLHLNSPHMDYIFKGDDDEFVNLEAVTQYISEHGSPDTVHGFYQHRPPVMRKTKYSITMTLYPQTHYPGFVSGGGFLFPGTAVERLYSASQLLPVFPLDDVYFGFLSLAANLTFRHDVRFRVQGLKYDACKYKEALVVHGVKLEDMAHVCQEVQKSSCQKVTPRPSAHRRHTKVNRHVRG